MASSGSRMSPRQKMINLMYIVLTAMLALNVSSDVLDGFTQVEEGLDLSNQTVARRNDAVYHTLATAADNNPDKAAGWHRRAKELRDEASRLVGMIDSLKLAIVRYVDGDDATLDHIDNRENLEASSVVMLNPLTRNGERLRHSIESFRTIAAEAVSDSIKRRGIASMLSTDGKRTEGSDVERRWENIRFENQPVVAAVALLTKLQNDILYSEGEALSSLLASVDAGDVRVNSLKAFVIPESRYVMRGSRYSADIVLAALDTTARPVMVIGGRRYEPGVARYEFTPAESGEFTLKGSLEVPLGDGSVATHPFESGYTVIEPTAAVSATMMNVLYAGIDNPIEIAVPGATTEQVTATMTGGQLTRNAGHWNARPDAKASEAIIKVSVNGHGAVQPVATHTFKVRQLPDPSAYIAVGSADGRTERYKGGRPIAKASLLASKGLGAAIDDGVLDIDFKVQSFETVFFDSMGNALLEKSDGADFSRRQLEQFRRLSRGKRFFISRIKAIGPDGSERTLSPVEVIVN
ncbi:gliding motility protein GldM [Muribaculaceae bacterium Isolate-105 (HZI)]|nr:gliding motility protein GldM [Muribaculaceae bacterium Isolate-105 (HZI)]